MLPPSVGPTVWQLSSSSSAADKTQHILYPSVFCFPFSYSLSVSSSFVLNPPFSQETCRMWVSRQGKSHPATPSCAHPVSQGISAHNQHCAAVASVQQLSYILQAGPQREQTPCACIHPHGLCWVRVTHELLIKLDTECLLSQVSLYLQWSCFLVQHEPEWPSLFL